MTNEKEEIKKKKAVAISYKPGYTAPKVVAKGQGFVAQKIIETAEESNVSIYEDSQLVEELNKIDLGLDIPPQLYEVVAQVLLFVSDLDKRAEMMKYGQK